MQTPDASDAEEMYFQRVVEDCERLLGSGIELRGLELDANGDVVLRLRYSLGKRIGRARVAARRSSPPTQRSAISSCLIVSGLAFEPCIWRRGSEP